MSFLRNRFAAVAIALSLFGGGLAGGLIGATVASSGAVGTMALAASNTPAATPSQGTRKFVPNEDPAHEAGESAAREAQEDAGQFPTVP